MKLRMFCTQAGTQASAPGKASHNCQLNVAPKGDLVDDANATAFADANARGGSITLSNLAPEAAAELVGGALYEVTITKIA